MLLTGFRQYPSPLEVAHCQSGAETGLGKGGREPAQIFLNKLG